MLGEVLQGQVQGVEEEESPPQAQYARSEEPNAPWLEPGSTSKVLKALTILRTKWLHEIISNQRINMSTSMINNQLHLRINIVQEQEHE